jgi:hypothetical protein
MSDYHDSQACIHDAETALREGDEARARVSYREAARLQRAFVDSLPAERVRTRSAYGLSVATLLYRAGDCQDAERLAHKLLAEPWIEVYSADKLRELLDRIWNDHRDQEPAPGADAEEASSNDRPSPARPPLHKRARTLPAMTTGRRLTPSTRRAA